MGVRLVPNPASEKEVGCLVEMPPFVFEERMLISFAVDYISPLLVAGRSPPEANRIFSTGGASRIGA